MKLVLCLASMLFSLVSADTVYYTVVYGNNVPNTVKTRLAGDEPALLTVMDSATPDVMSVYSTGQSFSEQPYSTTGGTTADNSVRKLFPTTRDLQMSTCPSSCKNSGSTYCRSLGCAYCTRCRRNLRSLAVSSTATTQIASSIKSELDSDLASYCTGASGCQLWTKVYEVNADGSLKELA
jgi:hypothetical protein